MKLKLSQQEKAIEEMIDQDEFIPVPKAEFKRIADLVAGRKKDMSLTIRVNSHDIDRIKKMARQKNIPYQTYLAEVIHSVAEGI